MTLMCLTERDAVCKCNTVQLHTVGFTASRTGTGENCSMPVRHTTQYSMSLRHNTRMLQYACQGHATIDHQYACQAQDKIVLPCVCEAQGTIVLQFLLGPRHNSSTVCVPDTGHISSAVSVRPRTQ